MNSDQKPRPDLTHLKPYGDTMDDGRIQLSFTLPAPDGDRALEAARLLLLSMGLSNPLIAWHEALDQDFTYFIAYGTYEKGIDYSRIQVESAGEETMSLAETDQFIRDYFGRKIRVIGASTGTDAHTVGIDAIMNMKGFAGHYGLERYAMLETLNLGSQVDNEDFIRQAVHFDADVLLVSQTVTQKDVHVKNISELVELLEAESLRQRFLLIVGGPRITNELAKELGCDAGFGSGKYADEVASYLAMEMVRRKESGRG